LRTQEELDRVAAELNGRPRKTLGWKKPIEVFNELIVEHCVAIAD
jgi:IS30 family transposase